MESRIISYGARCCAISTCDSDQLIEGPDRSRPNRQLIPSPRMIPDAAFPRFRSNTSRHGTRVKSDVTPVSSSTWT
jgi:hypothetical protein